MGVRTTDHRRPLWFGEGELKVYLDDDREWPTLVGTGTEDLVGSAWGLGRFDHLYQGAPLTEEKDGVWGFYRYHVPDPVFFTEGDPGDAAADRGRQRRASCASCLPSGGPSSSATTSASSRRHAPSPADESTWENFETPQDVCATAYWYQALPSPRWPALEPYAERVKDLGLPPKP